MIRYLLDVNVLIALVDPAHVQHEAAHAWFAATGRSAWASCPITEAGLIRVLGHPRYPNSPGPPAAVMPLLVDLRRQSGHAFWPDDISLTDTSLFDAAALLTASQVTDSYLLGLAVRHGGRLATFDRRITPTAVLGGADALTTLD